MYFWVKNCVFLNPPLQNSNDLEPPPYSIENSVPQKRTQDPEKGDNPKIQLYLTVLFLLIIAPLPVYLIVTGINQSCPVEPNLPFWMIVVGVCLFMEIVFTGHINSKKYIQHKNSSTTESFEVTGRPALMIILRKSIRLSVFGL
ncbi:hypothetical protein CAEBREN_21358 [Caenorhabditis brenneri]|uniref:Uncharacterized protein n=1 Tax=Caenorhabditis brenneri TaxID=135651 RepID=G0MRE1_CAEBE|nr:hypothetical protein CAEBREN_21358 [Caenorhabditis brenneri]